MSPINKLTDADIELLKKYPLLDAYQKVATRSAIYPGQGTVMGLMYCALKLNGEAGELAEHVGKAMRDDDLAVAYPDEEHYCGDLMVNLDAGELTESRKTLIVKEIGDNLWYLSALCNELGIKLSDAAVANIEKLNDRGKRGALRGSGDER